MHHSTRRAAGKYRTRPRRRTNTKYSPKLTPHSHRHLLPVLHSVRRRYKAVVALYTRTCSRGVLYSPSKSTLLLCATAVLYYYIHNRHHAVCTAQWMAYDNTKKQNALAARDFFSLFSSTPRRDNDLLSYLLNTRPRPTTITFSVCLSACLAGVLSQRQKISSRLLPAEHSSLRYRPIPNKPERSYAHTHTHTHPKKKILYSAHQRNSCTPYVCTPARPLAQASKRCSFRLLVFHEKSRNKRQPFFSFFLPYRQTVPNKTSTLCRVQI